MSAQGPTQIGPTLKRSQGQSFEFCGPSPHEAAVLPSAIVAKKVYFSIRMSSSLLKCLILMVASVVKKPYHDQGDSLVWTGPQ